MTVVKNLGRHNCQAVRDLEGKFHDLKLHHVLCDYNKAADVLGIQSQPGSTRRLRK
jgi:hypothetical protein